MIGIKHLLQRCAVKREKMNLRLRKRKDDYLRWTPLERSEWRARHGLTGEEWKDKRMFLSAFIGLGIVVLISFVAAVYAVVR